MKKLIFIVLVSTLFSVGIGLKTCVQRTTPGADPRIECVCNATYCDEFPPLGTLNSGQAAIYKSSLSGKRFERTDGLFGNSKIESKYKVINAVFNDTNKYQTIIGFGGAFTDATGYNIEKLSSDAQDNLLQAYFGDVGIGYTVSRVPVASCDFSLNEYSYCEVDGDFNMTTFNLTKEDFMYKIPFIKKASQFSNGKLQLFSTPWSAPGWMKTNGDMKGHGQLKGDVGGEYYQAFALYYYKFFEAYHNEGIDFWGMTILNEPFSNGDWQIMNLTADQERILLKQNLAPLLKNNDVTKDIKIMIHDDQRSTITGYVDTILADSDAASYVDGIAVHWYDDTITDPVILSQVHEKHPTKWILPTEACTGYTSSSQGGMRGDWQRALLYSYDIITDLQNWATGWTDWNLVLDENGGPNWVGNFVDAPITVSNTSDEFYKQPMYYALGHFSKFLQTGSQRVDLTTDSISTDYFEYVGFVTPNNQRVAIFDNRQKSDTYTVALTDAASGKTINFDMEPRSFATVVWNAN
ncbi:hypothetical protein FO519_003153 [Halicephalobus sp. NKZ332]|nr:hypothetical protein FO519_003153 [Halicephalobus sp. NKZ332]